MFEAVVGNEGSLAERVADSVLQLIIDQNLTCGEKLPNEFELAGKLHVGRGTVREAVKLFSNKSSFSPANFEHIS